MGLYTSRNNDCRTGVLESSLCPWWPLLVECLSWKIIYSLRKGWKCCLHKDLEESSYRMLPTSRLIQFESEIPPLSIDNIWSWVTLYMRASITMLLLLHFQQSVIATCRITALVPSILPLDKIQHHLVWSYRKYVHQYKKFTSISCKAPSTRDEALLLVPSEGIGIGTGVSEISSLRAWWLLVYYLNVKKNNLLTSEACCAYHFTSSSSENFTCFVAEDDAFKYKYFLIIGIKINKSAIATITYSCRYGFDFYPRPGLADGRSILGSCQLCQQFSFLLVTSSLLNIQELYQTNAKQINLKEENTLTEWDLIASSNIFKIISSSQWSLERISLPPLQSRVIPLWWKAFIVIDVCVLYLMHS